MAPFNIPYVSTGSTLGLLLFVSLFCQIFVIHGYLSLVYSDTPAVRVLAHASEDALGSQDYCFLFHFFCQIFMIHGYDPSPAYSCTPAGWITAKEHEQALGYHSQCLYQVPKFLEDFPHFTKYLTSSMHLRGSPPVWVSDVGPLNGRAEASFSWRSDPLLAPYFSTWSLYLP